jgi:Trk K+ transport system NAD-binding subunit
VGELEIIEAHLQAGSPAIGKIALDIPVPAGCSMFGVIRDGQPTPLKGDTVLAEGDKVIAIGRPDCEEELRGQLIGEHADA